jgi:hypothetical protein
MSKTTTIATHRPVAETLRNMRVGAVERFPLSQYNSVRASKCSTLIADVADGKDWRIEVDKANKRINVMRIS